MPELNDESLNAERFGPEIPSEETKPPQFSLGRLLVFVSVAALAAALYGERMRVDPPMRIRTHVILLGVLPFYLTVALSQRKRSLRRGGKTIYRLRRSYWPLSVYYRVTAVLWVSIVVGLMIAFGITSTKLPLTLGFFACLFILDWLILEAWWRTDLRDALICQYGIVFKGWLFGPWDHLQGLEFSKELPPTRVELNMRRPGLWPTNYFITLFLPDHDRQAVLDFLEQKVAERTN